MDCPKRNMLNEIIQYKKYRDYLNFSAFECKISILFSFFIIYTLFYFDVYDTYEVFSELYKRITLGIASSLVSLLGIIFAGIALVINLLKSDTFELIEKVNGKGTVQKLLVSFKFLVLNIGFAIMVFFYIFFLNHVNFYVPRYVFYVLVFVIIYYFNFIIFYCISLINNTIKIYFISNTYKNIVLEKSIIDIANEIRIDFILRSMVIGNTITKEQLLDELNELIDATNYSQNDAVKKYLNEYYSD